ncbi:hypothetical protein BC829DRAFT_401696 [Chytridium lagenaria]|nr:hypothetical protein BC829DRAFT_401696 [Chytridium lagenaria]
MSSWLKTKSGSSAALKGTPPAYATVDRPTESSSSSTGQPVYAVPISSLETAPPPTPSAVHESTVTPSSSSSTIVTIDPAAAAQPTAPKPSPYLPQIPDRPPANPSIYPIRGILYLFSHPQLWRQVICSLLGIVFAGLVITILLFVLALRPQANAFIYAFRNSSTNLEWLAWVLAVFLTLFESVFGVVIVAASFSLAVLRIRGHGDIISPVLHRHCLLRWHRLTVADTYRNLQSIFMAITLPVNAVPIIGTILYIAMNGYWRGSSYHILYLAMRGLKFKDSLQFFRDRRASYTSFGATAMALEAIPVLNCFFVFTNVIGAALWACDMEDEIKAAMAKAALEEAVNESSATSPPGMPGAPRPSAPPAVAVVMPAVSRMDAVNTASQLYPVPAKGKGKGGKTAATIRK